jgi:acyl dehydratase
MSLEDYLGIGRTDILGSHTFTAEEIRRFAIRFDPEPFHLDEEAARRTMLGGLCASGWHTGAMWMRYNVALRDDGAARPWKGPGPRPVFGPSPGIRELKWISPVFVGDTITFSRTGLTLAAHRWRKGWHLMELLAEAHDASGRKVMEFIASVLVNADGTPGPQ